jgi:hypothetical protein
LTTGSGLNCDNDDPQIFLRLITFEQFLTLAISYHPPQLPLEEVMEQFAELMQRLLEIQNGGRQRSPKLIAEDARLMAGLRERNLVGKSAQTATDSRGGSEQAQFKV